MAIAETEGYPSTELTEILDVIDAPPWAAAAEEEHVVADDPANNDRFRIADNGQADWAMRKLVRILEQAREVTDLAERQLEPIERWRTSQLTGLDRERLFWEALLTEYHRAVVGEDPSATSVKLPHGQLRSRKAPDAWTFDAEAFVEWARKNAPELIRTKEEIDKALAKKSLFVNDDLVAHLKVGDELIEAEGVAIAAGDRNFDVVIEGVAK